jgi:hypothetical protein
LLLTHPTDGVDHGNDHIEPKLKAVHQNKFMKKNENAAEWRFWQFL